MPYLLESTLYPLSENDGAIKFDEKEIQGALNNVKSVAIGMGLGQRGDNEKIIKYILENYDIPVIIDADGLNTLAKMDIDILKNTKCKVVLTPHLKELERLTGVPLKEIENSPIEYAKNYALKTGAVVLLKGPTTIITDGHEVYLTNTGCPGMASAGSGDVLSGILCAMCAGKEDILSYVSLGAYINGYAGQIAQKNMCDISMLASDTAMSIGLAIKELQQ
jgi:NAD(P)H-hydrate epimerase